MRTLYNLLLLAGLQSIANNQPPAWLWATSATGTGDERTTGIATDDTGNVLVTRIFSSDSITFGTTMLTNAGSQV